MSESAEDWSEIVRRIDEDNDPRAVISLSRLIASLLDRMGARNFYDDWQDLIQVVITEVTLNLRKKGVSDRSTVFGLIATVTRRRYADRLRKYYQQREDAREPLDGAAELPSLALGLTDQQIHELRSAVGRLKPEQAAVLTAVYFEGHTCEEAAERLGVPLGTLKRDLRKGLSTLRRLLPPG